MEIKNEIKNEENKKVFDKAINELNKKAKPPVQYLEKLELSDGEIYIGNLPQADKDQLLMRSLTEIRLLLKQQATLINNIALLAYKLAEKKGINITKTIDR